MIIVHEYTVIEATVRGTAAVIFSYALRLAITLKEVLTMNLMHLKYAVEVAETGSINRAAEALYVGQPNLSRSIKELEASLGTTLFDRSSKGMKLTPEGETFVQYAKNILKELDAMEEIFTKKPAGLRRLSVSVPHAAYIGEAFASFSRTLDATVAAEVYLQETGAQRALKNLLEDDYRMAVIRYPEEKDTFYKSMFAEKGLRYELVMEFPIVLLVNGDSAFAKQKTVLQAELNDATEIVYADPITPSLPLVNTKKDELPEGRRRIFVYERASAAEILAKNLHAFMWASPVPQSMLDRYHLTQLRCADFERQYRDVLVYREDYRLSDLDRAFVSELCSVKRDLAF